MYMSAFCPRHPRSRSDNPREPHDAPGRKPDAAAAVIVSDMSGAVHAMDADVGFEAFHRPQLHPERADWVVRARWQDVLHILSGAVYEHTVIP